jgi:hypothetical protein
LRGIFLFGGILVSLVATALAAPAYSSPDAAQVLPVIPGGLKSTFMVGMSNGPGNVAWMQNSGAAWDARYQYLVGGVNYPTNTNWTTWNSPPGQFATNYIEESTSKGYLPVFTYYQIYQSYPAVGANEAERDYNNLNNAATMNAYFADFKLLLDRIRLSGKTAMVHIEPDLWGFLQQRASNPLNVSAAVASSGYADVAAYPDNAAGFARALVGLRDKYAPKVLLAYHISPWSSTYGDIASNIYPGFNVTGAAQETANFYNQTGANFDLLFYDIADRDAGYYASVGQPNRLWDVTNTTFPNFNRFHQFAAAVTAVTNKRGILWQVPVGNNLYQTMNNTPHHWQDNRVQYYLGADDNQKLQNLADTGIVGLLYGAGDFQTTSYHDSAADGITNPNPVNGNNLVAAFADDDGGNLRLRGKAYYERGSLPLANPPLNPALTSTPGPGTTINIAASTGNLVNSPIIFSNSGSVGSNLRVSAPALSGTGAGSFQLSDDAAFSITGGAASRTVNVTCNPLAAGTLTATLKYSTNDPLLSEVTYNLACSVQAAAFDSFPAPGAAIALVAKPSHPATTTINITNKGEVGTTLNVHAPALYQSTPGIFTVTPTSGFSTNQGAAAQPVTVSCTPTGVGVKYTGTLTYTTSDPALGSVTYKLTCDSLLAITVTAPTDDGTGTKPGTLSEALNNYEANQIILFDVPGNKITMSGSTSLLVNRGPVVIDGGSCPGGVPSLTIDGAGLPLEGLRLGSGVQIRNILIKGFAKSLIVNITDPMGGGNRMDRCVVARKT